MANSSISTSNDAAAAPPINWRQLSRRLALFLLPFVLLAALGTPLLLRTGEFLPASVVAGLQTYERPFLYLPRFTDHSFALKVAATKLLRPEIVTIGSSRSNQWRSAMFEPVSFYNAGGPFYAVSDFIRALRAWGDYSPRVMIMTLDYFMFIDEFQSVAAASSKNDILSAQEMALALKGVMRLALSKPGILIPDQRDPIYGLPALGFQAIESGTGVRIDGSFQYGNVLLKYPRTSVEAAVEGVMQGGRWPLQAGAEMLPTLKRDFEDFVRLAHERKIALLVVTPPFDPAVLQALQRSAYHQAFRQFRSPQTVEWLKTLGVIYFDFADLHSFGGRPDEFVDPYHPSEPAYLRMLLKMMEDPRVASLLPDLDRDCLNVALTSASNLEVYRNYFPAAPAKIPDHSLGCRKSS